MMEQSMTAIPYETQSMPQANGLTAPMIPSMMSAVPFRGYAAAAAAAAAQAHQAATAGHYPVTWVHPGASYIMPTHAPQPAAPQQGNPSGQPLQQMEVRLLILKLPILQQNPLFTN
jgi:hypothetical protein